MRRLTPSKEPEMRLKGCWATDSRWDGIRFVRTDAGRHSLDLDDESV